MAQIHNRTSLWNQTDTNKISNIEKNVNSRRRHAVENFIVAWLNLDIDESNDATQKSIGDLQQIVNSIKIFHDADRCIMFLSEVRDEKVFIVVSGLLDSLFYSLIANKRQLASVYLIGTDQKEVEKAISNCQKTKGMFANMEELCKYLKDDVRQRENDLISINIALSSSKNDRNKLDPSFMYSQLIKEILLESNSTQGEKKDFFDFYRYYYQDITKKLRIINEMEEKYPNPSPIYWYTRPCFLYKMLNKALRTQDIEMITKMGFIIRDLHRNIEQYHREQNYQKPFFVHRGQGMSNVDFDLIKKSNGNLLAFNNFLSTSIDREKALEFAQDSRNSSDLTSVLFQIYIDPKISTAPFVKVDEKNGYFNEEEEEILFSMHTVFRIGETKEIEHRIFQIDLTLTNENDPKLTELINYIRQETQGPSGMHRLGQLMCHMGEFEKAEEVYTTLSEIISENDRQELSLIHHQLGYIKKQKKDLTSALLHYEKSLEIKSTYLSADDPQLSPTHSTIACVLQDQGDFDSALEHLQYALKIDLRASKPDHSGIATRYNNIGSVLEDQGNYEEALMSYERALSTQIELARLPEHHPSVATTLNNIGLVHRKMGDDSRALSFYQKTLDIFERTLPANHPSLAISHHNMAMLLFDLHRTKTAIVHAEKAWNITRHIFGHNHPDTVRRQACLEELRRHV